MTFCAGLLRFCIVLPIGWAYKVLFGWWLDPRRARKCEEEVRERVKQDLSFLFDDFVARFVPNAQTSKYGEIVTLEASTLRFRVALHHGEYFISVAPMHAPEDWEDIVAVLMAVSTERPITTKDDIPPKPSYLNLYELGQLTKHRFAQIERAFSQDRYPEIVHAIDTMHELGMRELAESYNRPYGYFRAEVIDGPARRGDQH